MTYELSGEEKNSTFTVEVVDSQTVLSNKTLSDEVVRLFTILTDLEVTYHDAFGLKINGSYTREIILKALTPDVKVFFLKNAEGKYIGMCKMQKSWYKDTYTLSALVIEENYRGRGLGKKLLDSIFTAYNNSNIVLTVSVANPHALQLYRSLGFIDTDIRMVRKAN